MRKRLKRAVPREKNLPERREKKPDRCLSERKGRRALTKAPSDAYHKSSDKK